MAHSRRAVGPSKALLVVSNSEKDQISTSLSLDSGVSLSTTAQDGPRLLDPEDYFPEGGLRAWLVVFGAFLSLVTSYGLITSIGTLQDYWSQHQLAAYAARDVSWISSVFVYLCLGLGIAVGPAVDRYGPRYLTLAGSIAYEATIFLLAECQQYWHFMLCLGVCGGVTAALLSTPSLTVVAHWFKRRRALAQGVAMAGSAFGGLMIPLLLRATLPTLGYRWSIRILGFVFLGCLVVANLVLKPRLVPSSSIERKPMISLSLYRDPRFAFLAVTCFCFEVVLMGIVGILPTYISRATDFSPNTGFYLIAVLNGVSFLGRVLPGYLADKIGRLNTFMITMFVTLVLMLALWLPFGDASLAAMYVSVALFGFGSGAWMGLAPASVGQLCRAEDFGRYYGTLYFVVSLATLVSIPISGELLQVLGPRAMVGFACAILGSSLLALTASRFACLGWKWDWKTIV